jgi:hypothetical protein
MLMKEYGIGSLTIYDVWKEKDELLKFSSATETTKATTQCHGPWKPYKVTS